MNEDKFSKSIDDEQLDQVAGGTRAEIQKDIKFLNAISEDFVLDFDLYEDSNIEDIAEAWKAVGVVTSLDHKKPNSYEQHYSLKNVEISRQDAMIEAMRATGKFVDLDQYL